MENFLLIIYLLGLTILFGFGMHGVVMLYYYYKTSKIAPDNQELPKILPNVTIQLPVFNEMYVIERLIKSICNIEYPKDKLEIQVLDDSTDNTIAIAKKLVEDVYSTGDKSVVENTWRHISEIWNLIKTVEEFLLEHDFHGSRKLSKVTVNQFVIFYGQMYNILVEKILAEYVFVISNYMKNHSEMEKIKKLSERYSKNYTKAAEQGKNPKRLLILEFLKIKYQRSCPAIEETEWRDAVAHSNYYFDENNQKLYLNKKPKDMQELIKKYEQLCGFCCTIINEEFSRRNIFGWLEEVKKTAEILSSQYG